MCIPVFEHLSGKDFPIFGHFHGYFLIKLRFWSLNALDFWVVNRPNTMGYWSQTSKMYSHVSEKKIPIFLDFLIFFFFEILDFRADFWFSVRFPCQNRNSDIAPLFHGNLSENQKSALKSRISKKKKNQKIQKNWKKLFWPRRLHFGDLGPVSHFLGSI